MKILIVYYSQSGNTKKVVEMAEERLKDLHHEVTVKNALTVKPEQVSDCNLLLIGTPVHGYILFGQKPTKEVNEFLANQLPQDLENKPVIGFATYLFFPAGALNRIKKAIDAQNGNLLGLIAQRRSKKTELVNEIIECIEDSF
ncbi:MAG: flavodoxin family protein [Candidatus Heimdallarchaeota archaeon]|nr:MAG: flavodoxin family protein [Candidatus Heimdallarchaeota archaeon]